MSSRNGAAMAAAISRRLMVRPSVVSQSRAFGSAVKGLRGKQSKRARKPCREVCRRGLNPAITGTPRRASSRSPCVGQRSTPRMMPVASDAAAIIRSGSGVKSTVTSTRSPRGRTPTPVLSRFAARSITGTCSRQVSSRANRRSPASVRPRSGGSETLKCVEKPSSRATEPTRFSHASSSPRRNAICSHSDRPARTQQPGSISMIGVATSITPVSK